MAWSTPLTAVAGAAFTAAQFNTYVRDLFLETAPAKATISNGAFFVTSATNTIAQRIVTGGADGGTDTTTGTAYGDLSATSGPAITVTTGSRGIVFIGSLMSNNTVNATSSMSFEVSGATTVAASDTNALRFTSATANAALCSSSVTYIALTAGSNTFKLVYKVSGGTGTFGPRRIFAVPF